MGFSVLAVYLRLVGWLGKECADHSMGLAEGTNAKLWRECGVMYSAHVRTVWWVCGRKSNLHAKYSMVMAVRASVKLW
jgi:hypothetical protein